MPPPPAKKKYKCTRRSKFLTHALIYTVTEFVSERGFLEVTGLPYDAYQAEISTSSETMKCSIFDYPIEVYGVTGGLVKDNIITCGGRGFKTFLWKTQNHTFRSGIYGFPS